jgi:glycosyltransferase involved in cell wall biosynthesis
MVVNILINNYNHEQYLHECIDSALTQTYENCEVLIVDDGSTDGSRSIIESYGERLTRIYKENGGQGSTFNAGIGQCHGEIVFLLDSDDLLMPDAVASVVKIWRSGVSKVQFHMELIGADGKPLGGSIPPAFRNKCNYRADVLRSGLYVTPPCSGNAFSASFLRAVLPLNEAEWRLAADTFPIMLAPLYGEVLSIPRPLGYYRLHASNQGAVGKSPFKAMEHVRRTYGKIESLINEHAVRTGQRVGQHLLQRHPGFLRTEFMSQASNVSSLKDLAQLVRTGERLVAASVAVTSYTVRQKVRIMLWVIAVLLTRGELRQRVAFMGLTGARFQRAATVAMGG